MVASYLPSDLKLRTSMIFLAGLLPTPSFFPSGTYHVFAPYFAFQWSWAVPVAAAYAMYYLALEPIAAVS